MENSLYYGDNLDVLPLHVKDETVDCVYLDPPFNSNATYNVLFAEQDGRRAAAQIKAFEDTWRWDQAAVAAYESVVEAGGTVAKTMQAFRTALGDTNMLAYLAMMAPRLVELHRVLKPTGNIFLHCDPTASHYLKMLMDAVFGARQFRNEIVWCYRGGGVPRKAFARKHDTIFMYAKGRDNYFNVQYVPYSDASQELVESRGGTSIDGRTRDLGRGAHMPDWWTDINALQTWSPERLSYPTQKPVALLERILAAGCPKDGVVLDPFCGCGTTIAAAQKVGIQWIGIDITHLAVNLMKHRLQDSFGPDITKTYRVVGEPYSLPDAEDLAATDKYQFQWWALGLVGARPADKKDQKKGPDKGIDGRLYFHDEPSGGKTKQVIISVKAGKPGVDDLRVLRAVVEREGAQIGALITMQKPTKPMRTEAAGAGTYQSPWGKHPRLQLLTVEELLGGARIDMPPPGAGLTFKQAKRVEAPGGDQLSLGS